MRLRRTATPTFRDTLIPIRGCPRSFGRAYTVNGPRDSRTFPAARGYARFVAIAYALLAILGLIPTANVWNTFGLIPISGNDVWLHALIAVAAAIVGFGGIRETAPGNAPYTTTTDTVPRI